MRIIRDDAFGTLTLVPSAPSEEKVLVSIIRILEPGDELSYGGRIGGDVVEGEKVFCSAIVFRAGIAELILRGETAADKNEIGCLRDCCFFGSRPGPIFLGGTKVDGKISIIITAGFCKHCGANMLTYISCEWGTCNECAKRCKHHIVEGILHGSGGIRAGKYCNKCGRAVPRTEAELAKTPEENHRDAEKKLGVKIINPRDIANIRDIIRKSINPLAE